MGFWRTKKKANGSLKNDIHRTLVSVGEADLEISVKVVPAVPSESPDGTAAVTTNPKPSLKRGARSLVIETRDGSSGTFREGEAPAGRSVNVKTIFMSHDGRWANIRFDDGSYRCFPVRMVIEFTEAAPVEQ